MKKKPKKMKIGSIRLGVEMIDVFDSNTDVAEKTTKNYDLDPESFGGEDFPSNPKDGIHPLTKSEVSRMLVGCSGATGWTPPTGPQGPTGPGDWAGNYPKSYYPPIVTPEEESVIKQFYDANPSLKQKELPSRPTSFNKYTIGSEQFHPNDAWIQTYSGRRFNPTNPYVDAIVIQDIAHPLSMQCRFSGHVKRFYSVAQHSVLVSYICDSQDALWGLLHDASEAYLVDVPRPVKRSGKFGAYIELENQMQKAICKRFSLSEEEPVSVKKADTILLATEARDLMSPLHPDWTQPCDPLPFKIEPLSQQDAKNLFMKRFYELLGHTGAYEHYLKYEYMPFGPTGPCGP